MAPDQNSDGRERRRHARFKVVPMYTRLQVRGPADDALPLDGHVYDISEGGLRFELDEPLPEGERVTVEIDLPGCQKLIKAYGKIVRVNDREDDPGPRRMALRFDSFVDEASKRALSRYLGEGWLEEERAA
ncbi:MAG: PilZ domain-containing protein [Phycisphaerae bacterium]|nr:PilZ domain-containing protein [Phycisphaerae bacterium]